MLSVFRTSLSRRGQEGVYARKVIITLFIFIPVPRYHKWLTVSERNVNSESVRIGMAYIFLVFFSACSIIFIVFKLNIYIVRVYGAL